MEKQKKKEYCSGVGTDTNNDGWIFDEIMGWGIVILFVLFIIYIIFKCINRS